MTDYQGINFVFCDPPGSLTHAVHCPKYQYFNYRYPFEGVRFGH